MKDKKMLNLEKTIKFIKSKIPNELDNYLNILDVDEGKDAIELMNCLEEKDFIEKILRTKNIENKGELFSISYIQFKLDILYELLTTKYIKKNISNFELDNFFNQYTYKYENKEYNYNKIDLFFKKIVNYLNLDEKNKEFQKKLLFDVKLNLVIEFADLEAFKKIEKEKEVNFEKVYIKGLFGNKNMLLNNRINPDLINYLNDRGYITKEEYKNFFDLGTREVRYFIYNMYNGKKEFKDDINFNYYKDKIKSKKLSTIMSNNFNHLNLAGPMFVSFFDLKEDFVNDFFKYESEININIKLNEICKLNKSEYVLIENIYKDLIINKVSKNKDKLNQCNENINIDIDKIKKILKICLGSIYFENISKLDIVIEKYVLESVTSYNDNKNVINKVIKI